MTPEDIIRRYGTLWSQRKTIEQTWDLVEKFIMPLHGGKFFQQQDSEHEIDWRRGRDVYDSTAILAAQFLASSVHSALTSNSTKWFDLKFKQDELNDDHEAKVWIEDCAKICDDAIKGSNFALEANELYLDLVGFGTSFISEEADDKNNIAFSTVPIREAYFEQDHIGLLYNFYRHYQWSPVQIISKFGIDNVPDEIKEKADDAVACDTKLDVIFCIYTRESKRDADISKPLPKADRPFGAKYILQKDSAMLGEEDGYYEMPVFNPRWRKTSGSMWGHSPGIIALSDVMTLNQLVEIILKAAEKVIDPPTLAREMDILNDLDLSAASLNVVRDPNGIVPYESRARFDVSGLLKSELQDSINRIFFVDQLQLKESPAMTATEAQIRYEMMQRLLGPTLGRLTIDFLDPMVERTFNIMYRTGKLPAPPESVASSQAELEIEYVGPMARAQKQDIVAGIEQTMGIVNSIAQINPAIMDIMNWTEAVRKIAELRGAPTELLRSNDELKEMAEQKAQQQQLAQAGQAGDVMKSMGEGIQAMAEAGQAPA